MPIALRGVVVAHIESKYFPTCCMHNRSTFSWWEKDNNSHRVKILLSPTFYEFPTFLGHMPRRQDKQHCVQPQGSLPWPRSVHTCTMTAG